MQPLLRLALLSTCSYRTLNFVAPMEYKQYAAVQRFLNKVAFGYEEAFKAAMKGAGYEEAAATALRGVRTAYPRLDEVPPLSEDPGGGSRSLPETLEGRE